MSRASVVPTLFDRPGTICALILFSMGVFLWPQFPLVQSALKLTLPDNDDAMRLLSVRDFLAGQSWFDMHQYRYLPPAGASIHWSRLVDLPIAAEVKLLGMFMNEETAFGTTAATWPFIVFGLYLAIVGAIMSRTIGVAAMGFAILVAGQMTVFADIFGAGRIDHHNVVALLITLAAAGFTFSNSTPRAAYLSGIASALVLAVSLEALPFVAGIGVLFGCFWVFGRADDEKSFSQYGTALALTSLFAFAAQNSPSSWTVSHCDALSAPWLFLTIGGGFIALALATLSSRVPSRLGRAAVAGTAVIALLLGFALAFPVCLSGPYHMVPEPYRTEWLRSIPEAFPLWRIWEVNPSATLRCYGPLMVASIVASFAIFRTHDDTRRMMIALASMLWLGVFLCLIQIRSIYVVSAFIPLTAGWAFHRLARAFSPPKARPAERFALVVVCSLLVGAFWHIGFSVTQVSAKYEATASSQGAKCILDKNVRSLDRLPKGIVLAPINLGAHLLVHTHHSIIAAGYHRAVDGIVAGIEAFGGSEDDMRRHAQDHHADYLVICPEWTAREPEGANAFARALAQGKAVSWLQPIVIDAGPLRVWNVVRR